MVRKVVLSILYPIVFMSTCFVLGVIIRDYTPGIKCHSLPTTATLKATFVCLPVFYYAVWKKEIASKLRWRGWAIGTFFACIMLILARLSRNLITLSLFSINIVDAKIILSVRVLLWLAIVLGSIKIAAKVMCIESGRSAVLT